MQILREIRKNSVPRIIINASSLNKTKTGIGQYTFFLIEHLKHNHKIDISLFDFNQKFKEKNTENFSILKSVKNSIRDNIPFMYDFHRAIKQKDFSKVIKEGAFDLYHEPNIISYNSSINKISTVHDLSWIRFPEFHPTSRVNFFNKYIKGVIQDSKRIIVDSFFIKNELINFFNIDDSKIDVIYLGSCFQSYISKNFELRNKKKKFFLTVGTIEPRKNLRNTIKAYVNLPPKIKKEFPLYIVGAHGWKNDNLIQIYNNKNENIIFLGYVSNSKLFKLFVEAICLIYPSFYEGFGLPVLEAMSVGTPVITSKGTVMEEIGGNSVLKINPYDSNEIIDQMLTLINYSSIYENYSISGFELAKKFSWEKCAKQTIETYLKSIN